MPVQKIINKTYEAIAQEFSDKTTSPNLKKERKKKLDKATGVKIDLELRTGK